MKYFQGKVLVTGGAGFIGSHIVDELLRRGLHVAVLDDFSTGKMENLPSGNERLEVIEGNILDQGRVTYSMRGCDAIVHLAAVASVQASIDNPEMTHSVNFDGTLRILEEARRTGVKRFLFASSAAVYGDASTGAISENNAVSPITPYAVDKLSCEYYLKHYAKAFGLAFTAFRFFNVYGPRQHPSSPYSGVISIYSSNAMAGKNLLVYGDGKQTRDFVFVKDVARLLADSLDNKEICEKIVNVGTGTSVSLLDMIGVIGNVLEKPIHFEHFPPRQGDIRHSLAKVELLQALAGNVPGTSLLEGLRETLFSYRHESSSAG